MSFDQEEKEKGIFPPSDGWEPQTWYLCEAKMFACNPPHKHLFFSGFLDGNSGEPSGYHGGFPVNYAPWPGDDPDSCSHLWDYYYLKVLRPVMDNEGNLLFEKTKTIYERRDECPSDEGRRVFQGAVNE